MDLRELESYRLSDAVKFNDQLNPRLWGSDEHLLPQVREKLLAMADDFREFLGVDDLEVRDITVSGSNAAYTYTDKSDIDLHLVVDMASVCDSDIMRELFDAKKYQYNDQHNFKIGGYDVELYVQDADQPHHSQGIYSVLNNDWVRVPERRQPKVNDISVQSKYEDLAARVDAAIETGDLERMDALAQKIRQLRQSGLDQHGEFGAENLAFKVMRGNGTLDRLRQARQAAKDQIMSLDERKKRKKKFSYGSFGGYYFPGYHYYSGSDAAADGGGDGGGESLRESQDTSAMLEKFVDFASAKLKLQNPPRMRLRRDPEWSRRNNTFGRYVPEEHALYVSIADRHPIDIMRTIAHELTHHRQEEISHMPDDAGETGSEWENEANAAAGIIMRDWADLHPELFDDSHVEEGWRERAAGVAAAACIAGTPGCATMQGATVGDVLQGVQTVGRAANTVKQTGTAGARELVIQRTKDELRRRRGEAVPEDYDPDHPPGPETPPTMPAGTVRVDVSDVYDWYKLGQHISNLKGLGQHDFGKGPPSTILSFGDEDTEHKYIQDLKRTGLDTTDIDPRAHDTKKGQKTDPTYNVNEASGYIPVNKKEAQDPRYSMALTVDIRPGETQRQAAKMGWKTDRAGRPPLLMKRLENQLQESLNAMKVKDIVKEATLGGFKVKPLKIGQQQVDELKLDAPQRRMSRDELQAYADRIKTGTKTKQDKFSPIIHGSNIKAIVRDDGGTEWDLDDLAQQITTRPRQILGTNAKMEKSKGEGEIVYDLTLPALSGIVVDEENGDFVEITTCPGAGQCQLFCYARKGGYVMFPASSMSAAQALNFLVNDPQGYMDTVNREITTIKNRAAKNGIKLVVRWHDAGDFFSKEYLDLAFDIARAHPDVEFYAYTKIADVATADKPSNFLINFSSGSKRGEEKKIELYKSQGNVPKEGVTVPKDMFFDLIAREGNKLIKDAKGRTQFKSSEALETFKQRLAQQYKINPNTIITYDEMLATPAGDKPQWNVIVQPGAGDRAANRRDVINSFLMFH